MAMILTADDANDWFYKGEGAANLVLGYCGSSPALLGKVLRVEKIQKGATRSAEECGVLTVHEKLVWATIGELVESKSKKVIQQAFVTTVLNPLLGSEHMDVGMHVSVSSEFLKIIEKTVHNKRPAWRVDAAEIDLLCDSALLMSDHSIFPSGTSKEGSCISVEIKDLTPLFSIGLAQVWISSMLRFHFQGKHHKEERDAIQNASIPEAS